MMALYIFITILLLWMGVYARNEDPYGRSASMVGDVPDDAPRWISFTAHVRQASGKKPSPPTLLAMGGKHPANHLRKNPAVAEGFSSPGVFSSSSSSRQSSVAHFELARSSPSRLALELDGEVNKRGQCGTGWDQFCRPVDNEANTPQYSYFRPGQCGVFSRPVYVQWCGQLCCAANPDACCETSSGLIVGVVLAALFILLTLAWYVYSRYHRQRNQKDSPPLGLEKDEQHTTTQDQEKDDKTPSSSTLDQGEMDDTLAETKP